MTSSVRGRQRRKVAARAGEQYDLYAYIRGELDADTTQGRFLIRAKFMDNNGASLGYSDIPAMYPGVISSWTRVGGRVTAPANSVSMQVQYLLYQSSGWVNIDDVEVTIVPPNAATEVTKYYYFGGQRVAMRKNGVLTYLHADHLGSTVLETNASGTVVNDEKYKAYGKQRDTGTVSTDHRFTGQKEDASGLQYFNARFYDPVMGMFVSPDTMVPQPELASDYNRYLAFRGNPMKYNDPNGHCASEYHNTKDGTYQRDGDEACWYLVDNIIRAWKEDRTGYWDKRYGSQEIFLKWVAPYASNDTDFMQSEMIRFSNDPGVKEKNKAITKADTYERKSRVDDPGPDALCKDPISQKCIVGMLDGFSTATSGVAAACGIAGQIECTAPMGAMSFGAGVLGTGISAINVAKQSRQLQNWVDLAVTATTTVVGKYAKPVIGFGASLFQMWYDFREK